MPEILSLVATAIGLCASLWAFLAWLRNLQRKQIESERNLAHALNNFANVSNAIAQLQECVESLTLAVTRVEMLMAARLDAPAPFSKIRGR